MKVGAHAVAVFGVPGVADWKEQVRRTYIRRHSGRPAPPVDGADDKPTENETERLRQRVVIVTSADRDLLADLKNTGGSHERAAALANEVVPT